MKMLLPSQITLVSKPRPTAAQTVGYTLRFTRFRGLLLSPAFLIPLSVLLLTLLTVVVTGILYATVFSEGQFRNHRDDIQRTIRSVPITTNVKVAKAQEFLESSTNFSFSHSGDLANKSDNGTLQTLDESAEMVQSQRGYMEIHSYKTESWRQMSYGYTSRKRTKKAISTEKRDALQLKYHWYFDEDIDAFLRAAFPSLRLEQMRRIERVDLFRYAVVFRKGGIWADADTLLKQPVYDWLPLYGWHPRYELEDFSLIVGIEFPNVPQITQWVFYAPHSQSAALSTVIDYCVRQLVASGVDNGNNASKTQRQYSDSAVMYTTGPLMFTRAVLAHICANIDTDNADNYVPANWSRHCQNSALSDLLLASAQLDKMGQVFHLQNDERILLLPYRAFGVHTLHPHNKRPVSQQLVKHKFAGSWRSL